MSERQDAADRDPGGEAADVRRRRQDHRAGAPPPCRPRARRPRPLARGTAPASLGHQGDSGSFITLTDESTLAARRRQAWDIRATAALSSRSRMKARSRHGAGKPCGAGDFSTGPFRQPLAGPAHSERLSLGRGRRRIPRTGADAAPSEPAGEAQRLEGPAGTPRGPRCCVLRACASPSRAVCGAVGRVPRACASCAWRAGDTELEKV